jgi:hypothetical protein
MNDYTVIATYQTPADAQPVYSQAFSAAIARTLSEWQELTDRVVAFDRILRCLRQSRHIAHAAYGLTRKGSQGWRRQR